MLVQMRARTTINMFISEKGRGGIQTSEKLPRSRPHGAPPPESDPPACCTVSNKRALITDQPCSALSGGHPQITAAWRGPRCIKNGCVKLAAPP